MCVHNLCAYVSLCWHVCVMCVACIVMHVYWFMQCTYVDVCVCAVCTCLVDVCMVYVSYPTLHYYSLSCSLLQLPITHSPLLLPPFPVLSSNCLSHTLHCYSLPFLFSPPIAYPTLSIATSFPVLSSNCLSHNSQVPSTVTEFSGSMGLLGRGCRVEQC